MPMKNGGKGRRDKPFLFGFGSFSGGRTVKLREGKIWMFLYLLKPLQSVVCKHKTCAKNYHLLTLSHETKSYFPFYILEIILTSRGTTWASTTYRTWHPTAAMIPECLETLYLQHLTGLSAGRNQRGFSVFIWFHSWKSSSSWESKGPTRPMLAYVCGVKKMQKLIDKRNEENVNSKHCSSNKNLNTTYNRYHIGTNKLKQTMAKNN